MITMRGPAIAAGGPFDIADGGKGHVIAGDQQVVGSRHVEQAPACRRRPPLVVVDIEGKVGALNGYCIVTAGIGPFIKYLEILKDSDSNLQKASELYKQIYTQCNLDPSLIP